MKQLFALSAFLLVMALMPIPSHAQDASDWTTYNYDFRGSRQNVAEKWLSVEDVKSLEIKWQFPPEDFKEKVGAIHATPSIVNGYVYFGTATYPKFYKLRPDGEIKWTYEIGDEGRNAQYPGGGSAPRRSAVA